MTEPIPYQQAISDAQSIAWWDMLPCILDPAAEQHFSSLQAGYTVECALPDFSAATLTEHRSNYARPGGHGLALKEQPDIVRVIRNADESFSALIGYSLADQ